jgi:O-antigen/teichoic acid export membrane protein
MLTDRIKEVWNNFQDDKLFRNSVYLILTTISMGGFGFIFWLISTRVFSPEEIGLGTTLISTVSLISLISLFGFNSTLIRFLPNSKNRSGEINTAFTLVTIITLISCIIYLSFLQFFTPKLLILRENNYYIIGFIIIAILSSINTLTNSIFIAYRATEYNLFTDGFIVSISKLLLPIFFLSLGAYGVFFSAGIATSIGMVASIVILVYKFNYFPKPTIEGSVIKKIFEYSFINYLGSLLSTSPSLILPIIIINKIGASESGYFFLCFMLINILYTISVSTSQSLFAEGSYGEDMLLKLLKRSVKLLFISMIPASIVLALLGPFVLSFFGESYKAGGASVIVILSLFSPVVAMYNLGNTLLKIRKQMFSIIFVNAVYAISICGLSYIWAEKGLAWIAFAWVIGNLISGAFAFIMIYLYKHLPTPKES